MGWDLVFKAFYPIIKGMYGVSNGVSNMLAEEKKRILIVEGEQENSLSVDEILSHEGYETQVVGSMDDAFDAIRSFSPNLVITDYDMPGFQGLGFYKRTEKSKNLCQCNCHVSTYKYRRCG